MKWSFLYLSLAMVFQSQVQADMTPSGAFSDGQAFGNANVGTAKAKINSTGASTEVPNYTASDPASGYYMGGTGSLNAPASTDVLGCTSTPGTADPDAHTHGKCESVRMLMDDPGKKNVMFPLNPKTDPIAVKRDLVAGDAETYLGSLIVSGAYAGCATKTVQDPDTYQTETCNQYLTAGEETCVETLNIIVQMNEVCVPGTYENPFTFTTHDRGGETWTTSSLCAGGGIRVQCSSGGSQTKSFTIPLNDPAATPVMGTTCYPHTKYPQLFRRFYYQNLVCDSTANSCTVQMFDVPDWAPYLYSCPPGQIQGLYGYPDGNCYDYDGNNLGAATLLGPNIEHTWTQTFRINSSEPTFIDSWDDQCTALEARLP